MIYVQAYATGTVHKALENSNAIYCNHSGQRRMPRVTKISEEKAMHNDAKRCKKCFG